MPGTLSVLVLRLLTPSKTNKLIMTNLYLEVRNVRCEGIELLLIMVKRQIREVYE